MNVESVINKQLEPMNSDDFVKEALELYAHYESVNDTITMEYIAVRLNTIYNQKKERPNLVGFLEEREGVDEMGDKARMLVQKRVGKPGMKQMILSFVVIVAWYQLMTSILKLDPTVSMIVTIIAMIIFNYLYVTISGNRMVTQSNKLYKEKVNPKLIRYFNFYLD